MKNFLSGILIFAIFIAACEKFNADSDLIFKIGDDLKYSYQDFELYDSSTHILYFRTNHPEFETMKQEEFAFCNNRDKIFEGSFWPAYSFYIPDGIIIFTTPLLYPNYSLRFEYRYPNKKDPINDPHLISTLKDHGLLHSGLSVLIDSIVITRTQLTFSFTVINSDLSNLLILDIDKMGPYLYHYFTNGLVIRDLSYNEVFLANIELREPFPRNGWEADWLTQLDSGDSIKFTINYTIDSPLNPGEYVAAFSFPELGHHLTRDQLIQGSARIWLGSDRVNKRIIIY